MEAMLTEEHFVIGSKDAIHDPSVVAVTFLINKVYARLLFDFGDDKSFITPTFRQNLNHESRKRREEYEVQTATGKTGST